MFGQGNEDNGAFQVAVVVENLPTNAGDLRDASSILGWEDPLEEGLAAHSSILAWRTPWTGAWWATVHSVTELDTPQAT